MKLRDKMAKVAVEFGGVEIEGRSGKYRTFAMPDNWYCESDYPFVFIGKAGAFRAGKCATKSSDFSWRRPIQEKLAAI